jgi:hypothetical protein
MEDRHLFRALWEISQLEKRQGGYEQALPIWRDLADVKNEFRCAALEELAKHFEHRERNYPAALQMTAAALALDPSAALERRRARLERKTAVTMRLL